MGIENLQFLQATNPSITQQQQQRNVQYNPETYAVQQSGGYNPYYNASVEDLELANAIAEGNYSTGLSGVSSPGIMPSSQGLQGVSYEGFSIPEYTGSGELSPVVSDREDSIEDCPWEAYYA